MLDSLPIKHLKLIDIEALLLASLLLLIGRLASLFPPNSILSLISVISAFSFILLFGVKTSLFIIEKTHFDNKKLVVLCLVPLLATGFVYLTWMVTATFSTLAPLVVFIVTFLAVLLPPKIHLIKLVRRFMPSVAELNKQKVVVGFFVIQILLMVLSLVALSNAANSTWLTNVFEGLPVWTYACIFAVFGITIGIALTESRLWPISVLTMTFWARSFLFARGFVHFGGDDGENIAIVKYLMNGHIAPFLNLSVIPNVWNWRYGSFETLNFNSNMAFLSTLTNLSPDFYAGVMSLVISSLLLVIGGYALSRVVLKRELAVRLSLIFILALTTAAFWWQLRFDPNLFVSVLFPSYLAVTLLLPNTKTGLLIFVFSSFIMFSAHPLGVLLVAPCVVYKIIAYVRKSTDYNFVQYLKRNTKKVLLSVAFLTVIAVVLFFTVSDFIFYILRLFSISNLFGLSPGGALAIGNYVSSSYLITFYIPTYYLSFLFMIVVFVICLVVWRKTNQTFFNRMKSLILVISIIGLELFFIDCFVRANPDPVWRLWSTFTLIMAPVAAAVFSLLPRYEHPLFAKKSFSVSKKTFIKVLALLLLTLIVTLSFVESAYPIQESLNLDTITSQEFNLLKTFVDSVNLNQSLYLGEYPTMRYISGIRNDWPASGNLIGDNRVNAFASIVYGSNITDAITIASQQHLTNIYVIILNRYAGEKPASWFGGYPYLANVTSLGQVILENNAGYILKLKYTNTNNTIPSLD